MEISISENQLIRKHNRLVESKHAQMSTMEKKLLAIAIAQIKNEDESFDLYKIPAHDIRKALSLTSGDFYKQLKDIADRLYHRSFMIEVPGKSWEFFRFVDKARYKDGFFYIQLHRDLAPFLLNLYKDYTAYELRHVLMLGSGHSITIYEWLKKWSKLGKKEITLVELKERLGVQENKSYENFKDFRRRILEPASKEINEKSDIIFYYETTKEKQRVVGLVFFISIKEHTNEETAEQCVYTESQQALIDDIVSKQWFRKEEARKFVLQHDENKIRDGIAFLVEQYEKQGKEITNPAGLLFKAISENYKAQPTATQIKEEKKAARLEAEKQAKRLEKEQKDKEKAENMALWERFLALPEDERIIIIGQILSLRGNIVREKYNTRGVNDPIVKGNIINHIKGLWGK